MRRDPFWRSLAVASLQKGSYVVYRLERPPDQMRKNLFLEEQKGLLSRLTGDVIPGEALAKAYGPGLGNALQNIYIRPQGS